MIIYYWYIIIIKDTPTDIQAHVNYLSHNICIEHKPAPANSGFYYITWLLAGFSCDYTLLLKIAVVFLGLSWGATALLSTYAGLHLSSWENEYENQIKHSDFSILSTLLVAIISCIIFPIIVSRSTLYLGLFPPNVYHNSTWLGGLPWTIVIFFLGTYQLRAESQKLRFEILIGILLIISAWFKPSFAFVFVPSYALLRVAHTRWGLLPSLVLPFSLSLLPVVVFVIGQVLWIAAFPQTNPSKDDAHFAFAFPAGWRYAMPYLPWDRALIRFGSSFFLPAVAYYLRPDWLKHVSHKLALLCTIVGFLLFMLVYETGERSTHGNLLWQCFYANHIVYWIIILSAINWKPSSSIEKRQRIILFIVIIINIVSGLIYLTSIIIKRDYS
ncbi:hypothetical protein [Hymenobacter norwichensis]|uniref:hypothetical protein n=1 Tax=Hymenobacter norwichensis TaxID=223903 RepID=UPI0012FA5CF0|nr:hypothetical protein [Hymenobacter norwichensis]